MNWRFWRRKPVDPGPNGLRKIRPDKGHCPGCGVDVFVWCRKDCTYVDPMDYR